MAYRVSWRVPNQILSVELEGDLSLDDFNHINRAILELLGSEVTDQHLVLLVDITRPGSIPRAFDQLRASQTYTLRTDLKFILIASSDKFVRLMMMLTFNLCRPALRFFDTIDQALTVAQTVSKPHVTGGAHS